MKRKSDKQVAAERVNIIRLISIIAVLATAGIVWYFFGIIASFVVAWLGSALVMFLLGSNFNQGILQLTVVTIHPGEREIARRLKASQRAAMKREPA